MGSKQNPGNPTVMQKKGQTLKTVENKSGTQGTNKDSQTQEST